MIAHTSTASHCPPLAHCPSLHGSPAEKEAALADARNPHLIQEAIAFLRSQPLTIGSDAVSALSVLCHVLVQALTEDDDQCRAVYSNLALLLQDCFGGLSIDRDVAVSIASGVVGPPRSLFRGLARFAPHFRSVDTVQRCFEMASCLLEMCVGSSGPPFGCSVGSGCVGVVWVGGCVGVVWVGGCVGVCV